MTLDTKFVAECVSLDSARTVAGYLEALGFAEPSAVTLFENPTTKLWRVEGYFEPGEDLDRVKAAVEAVAPPDASIALEAVPDENWVAISQAALPPVYAGRFVVHGSHDRARVGRRLTAIEIEAGEAFGTAHHATTYGCLLALGRMASETRPPRRIHDLGCGSAVLAIAASRIFPAAAITASDIDPVSVDVARQNIVLNGAKAHIGTMVAMGLDHPKLRGTGRFDLIVANILAGPLIMLAPDISRAVEVGGRIVLSGLLAHQAAQVIAAYRAVGFAVVSRHVITGWATLLLQRRPF